MFKLSKWNPSDKIDSQLEVLLIRNEDFRSGPYQDGRGVSIGIGRDLTTEGLSVTEFYTLFETIDYRYLLMHCHVTGSRIYVPVLDVAKQMFGGGLSRQAAKYLLSNDVLRVATEAKRVFPKWDSIETPRQHAIIDCLYNLGLSHFELFHKFIDAVKARDWDEAAYQLEDSSVARSKENRERYKQNSEVIRTGDPKHFELTGG